MKVLITGGAGYVGTNLTQALAQQESVEEIIIYDNLSHGHSNFFIGERISNHTKVRFVNADILDSRQLKKALEQVDSVVHLAARVTTPFANTDPHFFEQINHWGTAEVVYAAEEKSIDKLIYLSSTSAFGASSKMINEETIPVPRTFYGISKMRGEEQVRRLSEKMNCLILRAGNVYGYSKSMRFDAVINRFMFHANFAGRIQIYGTGKQTRGFIHIDYLIDTIVKSLLGQVPSGTYNLVDKNLMIFDIVDVLKEMYPDLEFLFSNQHMNLRELKVERESKLYEHIARYDTKELKSELEEMKNQFSF